MLKKESIIYLTIGASNFIMKDRCDEVDVRGTEWEQTERQHGLKSTIFRQALQAFTICRHTESSMVDARQQMGKISAAAYIIW